MDILDAVRAEWSWAIPKPAAVRTVSKFGNLLVLDADGGAWRICPEELSCEQIATGEAELLAVLSDAEFQADWAMAALVSDAESRFGVQPEGRCFCLKMPAVLGGEYAVSNVGTISITELIAFAGDVARQIKDLPNGAQVRFNWDV